MLICVEGKILDIERRDNMIYLIVIGHLILGILSSIYIAIDINKEAYGYKFIKVGDLTFFPIFILAGYIAFIAVILHFTFTKVFSKIPIDNEKIIWSEKEEEDERI